MTRHCAPKLLSTSSPAFLVGLVVAALLLTQACADLRLGEGTSEPAVVAAAGEQTPILCTDGIDNDNDGLIDCDDPQCTEKGADNDPECLSGPCPGRVVCLTTEDSDFLCADGVDNDGNGFIDCGDFGCARNANVTICCAASSPTEDTPALCLDGLDNDCNGYTDCEDFGCSRNTDVCCTPLGAEDSDETCTDGIDNDCNGYSDCDDFNCSRAATVTVCAEPAPEAPETSESACSDGVDNDRDGYRDCADWDCKAVDGTSPFLYCQQAVPENSEAACSDGTDNDRDGLIDCRDWDCWNAFPALCAG